MENLRIKVSHDQKVTVVTLLDQDILDEIIVKEVAKSLFALVEDQTPVQMLLNFAKVKRLSSDMLGTILRLSKRINQNRGALKLCCIISPIYEIFVITKINQIFDIYDDQKTALKSFQG
jgi:anti-sigma B factor antagonist